MFRCKAETRCCTENITLRYKNKGVLGLTQACRRLDQCVEYRLEIESRAANDLKHLRSCGLLLKCFVTLSRALLELLLQIGGG